MAHVGVPGARKLDKPQQAIMLEDTGTVAATPEAMAGFSGGRWIRGYGVLLHLNLVKADNREIAVTVTSYATDRRSWPPRIFPPTQRPTHPKGASRGLKGTKKQPPKGGSRPGRIP